MDIHMILREHFVRDFIFYKVRDLIFLCTIKFNVLKYCYLSLIIQYNINHLFAQSEVVSSIVI